MPTVRNRLIALVIASLLSIGAGVILSGVAALDAHHATAEETGTGG